MEIPEHSSGATPTTSTGSRTRMSKTTTQMDFQTFRQCIIELAQDEEASAALRGIMMPAIEPLIKENSINIATLITKVKQQQQQIDALEDEMETMRQQSRKKVLVISGLVLKENDSAEQATIGLMKEKLKVNLHPVDIDSVIVGRKNKEHSPPNVILTLTTIRKKVEIMRAKKNLRQLEDKIYINEQLTQKQGELFATTRSLCKKKMLHATWTRDGRVYIKHSDASTPVVIKKMEETQKLLKKL